MLYLLLHLFKLFAKNSNKQNKCLIKNNKMTIINENGEEVELDAPLFGLDAPFITTTLNNASLSDINFKSPLLENHRGMTNVSSYAEIPFTSKSQGSIKRIYYPGAKVDTINNIKIATDVNTDPNRITYIKKRKLFFDKNVNKTFEKGVDVLAYNIELYFSKDAIKLKECFKVTKTEPNGIIFFIEDNTDDISAQFCRIKIGNRVRDNLKHESQLYSNKKVLDYINEYVSIDKAVLEELIRNKKIENVSLKSVEFLFAANDYLNPYALDKKLIAVLGKVCGSIAKFIDKAKLAKHRWNPDVKKLKDDGTVDQTHTFKPFLFPFIEEGLDTVPDHKLNDYAIKAFTELQTGFYKQDAKIRQYVQQTDFGKLATVPITIAGIPFTAMTPLEIDLIPDSLERYVFSKYIQISEAIQSTFKQLEQFDFTDLIKKGVRIANAYLCGIWNGLIDAISGIFKMLEMLFNGIVTMQDFTANFSTQFPLLMEYVDNAIVAIKNIDFKALYTHLKGKLDSITNVSLETIAYFSGAFVGFVVSLAVEVVVGILFTGGTLSVAAVLEKLATVFSGIFRGIANAGRAAFNYTKKIIITTFKGFTKLLDELVALLNKSTKEFKGLIDELFEGNKSPLKDIAKSINTYTDIAIKKSKSFDNIADEVKLFEDSIKLNKKENAKLFDEDGSVLSKLLIGDKYSVKIPKIDILRARKKLRELGKHIEDLIITHSHPPPGSSLSFEDILLAMKHNAKEFRAVNPDGTVFSLIRKKRFPYVDDDVFDFADIINRKLKYEFSHLKKGSIEYQLKQADLAVEALRDVVEYIHYIN